jgi:lipid-A-disaccharide synthase
MGLKSILIIAGEASGDLHGANLVKSLRQQRNDLRFWGIGGNRMAEAGVELIFSSRDLAVVGLTEVFAKLGAIGRAVHGIRAGLIHRKPDLAILIDYPGFNLYIARFARKERVPVLYYISPQVWAWRRGRIRKISRRVNRMAVILPFEAPFYRDHGVEVEYVGHPLMDACSPDGGFEAAASLKRVQKGEIVVGLLPGSRREEIMRILPEMVGAAEILKERRGVNRFMLQLADGIAPDWVRRIMGRPAVEIQVVGGPIYDMLGECDVVLAASGTVTLETAIAGVPMVIGYKLSPLTFRVAKAVVKVRHIGLVNLVAGGPVVPELVQRDCTAEAMAREAMRILDDSEYRAEMVRGLEDVRLRLSRGGASERAAMIALEMIEESGYSNKC